MNYFIDLFSPETAKAFDVSKKDISGFRITQKHYVEGKKIGPGDRFICYVTRIQRFIGVLEVVSEFFVEDSPIFSKDNDPFTLRFKVKPIVWLPLEKAIPIDDNVLWRNLSFTKKLEKGDRSYTHLLFASPRLWPKDDCKYLEDVLVKQSKEMLDYPFSDDDLKKMKTQKIKVRGKKEITVNVPEDEDEIVAEPVLSKDIRASIRAQAKLAEIGEKLGLKIWLPQSDRSKILEIWHPQENSLLDDLPLVFDEITLKTIRNIDVLWIKRRAIVRAFEVEDTTSIYSGILRMADLLALQPMLDIKIHIVAPVSRRDLVMKQITRPVFSVMEKGPLSEFCSYISYESVYKLAEENRLEYMTDTIIDEFSEYSED